jgi:chemotaxis protein MotA
MASSIPEAEEGLPPLDTERVHRRTFDLATLLGLGGAVALIVGALAMGGSGKAFLNLPAALIVIGGTFAVTTVCFSLREMLQAQSMVLRTLFRTHRDPSDAAVQMLEFAVLARRNGVLSLQVAAESVGASDPFLGQALTMVADGSTGDVIERVLKTEIAATSARHAKGASVLRKGAEVAPAMGLIGTLVGLVQMLGNLSDPSNIGPAMAVALLTTFYGATLANVVLAPLASKLERNSREEILVKHIFLMASSSIARQENPRRLEMLLNSVLPPSKRVQYFD